MILLLYLLLFVLLSVFGFIPEKKQSFPFFGFSNELNIIQYEHGAAYFSGFKLVFIEYTYSSKLTISLK